MNPIYKNNPTSAPDADKYGHVIGITSDQRIAYSNLWGPVSDDQRVIGLEVGQVMRIKRILAPTDLGDDSRKAVNYAVHLAQLIDAQLTLLHFYDESWRWVTLTGANHYQSMLEEERTARSNLYALRDEIRKMYSRCDSEFYIGSPAKEIPKVAKELSADLIVISTHNPQGSSRWIFGSNAERIVGSAPCPVLIVR
jgi:nucleotide-binding universal stress UspA family protein